jgi:uncharacterized protein YndB with AHSA1/START domain
MSNENGNSLHVTEQFVSNKEELYKAWTEPDQLKQWWKPMGKQLVNVENDIRQGGKVVYRFEDGLSIHGEYKEARPGEKLSYSWIWELPEDSMHKGEYLLHVQFNQDGNNSVLDVTQENFKEEHSVKPHEEGWKESLEALKNYLEHSR